MDRKFKIGDEVIVNHDIAGMRRGEVGTIIKKIDTTDMYRLELRGTGGHYNMLEDYLSPYIPEFAPKSELSNTMTLLKDIDTEIRDVQDSAHQLQKWGFVDQGSQASYAAGTFSRLRDRFVQALKEDGVDIEE